MIPLRRHVVAVVAALFALAVGIALGGGPLSYVPDQEPSVASDAGGDDDSEPVAEPDAAAPDDGYAQAFAGAAASRLYDSALLGHPTAIVAMPGVAPDLVAQMTEQVAAAGGGLTAVFELTAEAVDRDEVTLVDNLTAQLMTGLGDSRIDPTATTYARLGQLLSVGVATPVKSGQRASDSAVAIRSSLSTAGLVTADPEARLAALVLVLLPESDDDDLTDAAVHQGIVSGLAVNAVGVVVLGDTASGEDGVLADLREDSLVTSTVSTVDGGDTVLGRVTAMLALIASLKGSVGAYGASGADGAVPLP